MKQNEDYKVFKIKLQDIILNNDIKIKITDACRRTHLITTHVYQFIRLYILNCYHNNVTIPYVDVNFIKMTFKVLSLDSRGPKPKNENLETFNLLNAFYEKEYSKIGLNTKVNTSNLSQILMYVSTDILTNIENNIKLHFVKYLNRFVNSSFKDKNDKIIEEIKKQKDKTLKSKELYKELFEIKNDFINNTSTCLKHKEFIDKYRDKILPKDYKDISDLDVHPQKYIKHMIFMNLEIERLNKKQFQFFPLRNDFNLKYIPLDSKIVVDLLMKMNKGEKKQDYLSDIINSKEQIWNSSFNLKHKIFKPKSKKQYIFNHMIYTDGYGVSLQFINKNNIEKENLKKLNMKKAKEKNKEKCKGKSDEEIKLIKEEIKKEKQEKEEKKKLKNIKIKKEKREEYKSNKVNKSVNKEFKYINDLNDKELNEAIKNYIVIDPGKRDLLKMLQNKNGKNKFLSYTYKQRINEMGKEKMNKQLKKYKTKKGIEELEKKFNKTCKKSNKIENFKEYLKVKMEVYDTLTSLYEQSKSRRFKWYSYLNSKRSYDNLIKNIKKEYGKDVTLFMGDWSNGTSQMKHFISTPRIGLKRKLKKHFKVYNLDEYKTSKMCYKTKKETSNLSVKVIIDEKETFKRLHPVLTYNMENNRLGCLNRDKNSCLNMLEIVKSWKLKKEYPTYLKRTNVIVNPV